MFAIALHKTFPLLICLIAVPVSESAAESLEVFVDRVIEVYGGKDAQSRAAAVRAFEDMDRSRSIPLPSTWAQSDKWRTAQFPQPFGAP